MEAADMLSERRTVHTAMRQERRRTLFDRQAGSKAGHGQKAGAQPPSSASNVPAVPARKEERESTTPSAALSPAAFPPSCWRGTATGQGLQRRPRVSVPSLEPLSARHVRIRVAGGTLGAFDFAHLGTKRVVCFLLAHHFSFHSFVMTSHTSS